MEKLQKNSVKRFNLLHRQFMHVCSFHQVPNKKKNYSSFFVQKKQYAKNTF